MKSILLALSLIAMSSVGYAGVKSAAVRTAEKTLVKVATKNYHVQTPKQLLATIQKTARNTDAKKIEAGLIEAKEGDIVVRVSNEITEESFQPGAKMARDVVFSIDLPVKFEHRNISDLKKLVSKTLREHNLSVADVKSTDEGMTALKLKLSDGSYENGKVMAEKLSSALKQIREVIKEQKKIAIKRIIQDGRKANGTR